MSSRAFVALFLIAAAGACREAPREPQFPKAHREVAPIVGDSFSTEDARDRVGEAEQVIELAGVQPGMSVADIGAGEGYYTVRLAPVVGRRGRVLAEDILPEVEDRLVQRVHRESLDNVAVKLGSPDNPMLPMRSFDRIFMVHMYHEVESPYAFLWHMREGLKPDGQVIVVDANREPKRHGIQPRLLACEFAAVGLKLVHVEPIAEGENYFASFRIGGPRPEPELIRACRG
ncbi:MAG TPA: methyltransferase domain-containing protein [Sphingomicrobium sp.]|nr:methyltransferase domain-containing protein [Sphingomicrobium sp.]